MLGSNSPRSDAGGAAPSQDRNPRTSLEPDVSSGVVITRPQNGRKKDYDLRNISSD
jgi:hypothetical protein